MTKGLTRKYFWSAGFDAGKVNHGLALVLQRHVSGHGPTAVSDGLRLIQRFGADSRVTDIRAMAYMLATAARESKKIKQYDLPKLAKNGTPVLDKKTCKPVMRHPMLWTVFQPIEETGHGAGRRYHDTVKVLRVGAGAVVTERDGEQFAVAADGTFRAATGTARTAAPGSTAGMRPQDTYVRAAGDEHAYFGRGLVQLTWWNSYASAGIELGIGLELLLHPERLLEFEMSYQVMTMGMLSGKSFANGHACRDYFTDSKTDYAGARAMVNANDPLTSIVNAAIAFETLLMDSRIEPAQS